MITNAVVNIIFRDGPLTDADGAFPMTGVPGLGEYLLIQGHEYAVKRVVWVDGEPSIACDYISSVADIVRVLEAGAIA